MSRVFLVVLTCVTLGVTGCYAPHIQTPAVTPKHPAIEKLSQEFHDPFPDAQLGPDVDQRPRGYNVPRAQPRKAKETWGTVQRIQGLPETPPRNPPLGSKYDGTVQPQ